MNKINLVILEDDLLFQAILESMLHKSEFRICKIFDNSENIEEYIHTEDIDIILSDIYIGKNPDGADVIKSLFKTNIPIVCITSSQEDEIYNDLYENVSGYLIKPFHRLTLLTALRKAIKEYKKNKLFDFIDKKYIMLTGKSGKYEKVNFTDIIHLEASGNYTILQTTNGKYAKKISLNKLLEFELDTRFKRIHRKYIVNTHLIKSITATSLTLHNSLKYTISKNYKKNLMDLIKKRSTP